MNAPLKPVAALGFRGGPLEGRKVVRFVFIDKGGISRDEPFAVVAGIFVHRDEQLIPLEDELERVKQKHIPKEDQKDLVFHATDIWSGTGKVFKDRNKWPLPRRLEILHDLARIPCRFDTPSSISALSAANLFRPRPSSSVRAEDLPILSDTLRCTQALSARPFSAPKRL
jgi:hypothetical protein